MDRNQTITAVAISWAAVVFLIVAVVGGMRCAEIRADCITAAQRPEQVIACDQDS